VLRDSLGPGLRRDDDPKRDDERKRPSNRQTRS